MSEYIKIVTGWFVDKGFKLDTIEEVKYKVDLKFRGKGKFYLVSLSYEDGLIRPYGVYLQEIQEDEITDTLRVNLLHVGSIEYAIEYLEGRF